MTAVHSRPSVSVVIPAYEAERFLGEAIESVLAQTYSPVEMIVVDDGSTDRTAEVAAAYDGVKVIVQENSGPSAARNRGFAAASGEFIAFHDSDDADDARQAGGADRPHAREPRRGLRARHPRADRRARGRAALLGRRLGGADRDAARPAELTDEPDVHPMTMVVRREAFERVGDFDPTMRAAEDFDWMLRASEEGVEIARLSDQVLLRRRVHPASLTQDAAAGRAGLFRAFKGRIERHRARAAE